MNLKPYFEALNEAKEENISLEKNGTIKITFIDGVNPVTKIYKIVDLGYSGYPQIAVTEAKTVKRKRED